MLDFYKPCLSFASAGLLAVALSACDGGGKAPDMPAEEEKNPTDLVCNSSNTRGTVHLNIAGNPGDSFRIFLLCGNVTVTQCTATVPAGGNAATCTAQGAVPNGGLRTCPVGPGNGNTAAARVVASGCG